MLLNVLLANYRVIRQVIPHPVWFAELTGVHSSVADNVLNGTRKISLRHVLSVAQAFGIDAAQVQLPISGQLNADSPGNLKRAAWLRSQMTILGGARRAAQQFPGLGVKTIVRLMQPGVIVSPLMVELIARHLQVSVPVELLGGVADCGTIGCAEDLLSAIRLDRHREVSDEVLPRRTRVAMVAVAADIRFATISFDSVQTWLRSGRIDARVRAQVQWLRQRLLAEHATGVLSFAELSGLRRLIREAETHCRLEIQRARAA
ncbi:hypothetical protein C7S18_04360 [Ahniella affigens]|uniref:HTH cro/C1-type domain-containing protein n=1 Tax=Ahniella affigens TaxID=2021234 RepID=A0A2P1PNP7_9GAMM|nr:hypothetical protein [Ahniella affigens]AVP96474.1 hypothetical protein C7S18_04360 [Ahniella affigens]